MYDSIDDVYASLLQAARSLLTPSQRPAFLGSGGFGGPWSSRLD